VTLFSEHPGRYYYCTLVTTGEAHPPIVSAWSKEALAASAAQERDLDPQRTLKWSYADSPYCGYGSEYFETVNGLFAKRPRLSPVLSKAEWSAEYQVRLDAMEAAMERLDSEGIFGVGTSRLGTVVLVEVAPPDRSNTERALRLNPPEALTEWLEEAAE
jgi:hypothetical protein